jgi:UDP-N-acetylmuramoyl-L-alanyl-D-glutamate--2,6-diaminopimelate ligase
MADNMPRGLGWRPERVAMNLAHLIHDLRLSHVAGPDPATVSVTDLTDDSRQVAAGGLWLVRAGGEAYLDEAMAKRPATVIAAPGVTPRHGVCWLTCDAAAADDQALAGALAARFFGDPAGQLQLVGITGTKGKTTTAILIQHLLASAGRKCGLIGTIWIDDGATRRPAELTTPGAIEFTRLLRTMVDHGCRAAVAEVSSHALHQKRVSATRFAVGVFTNLTGDHLDYHKTMDAYADAKAILFASLPADGWAVINADDAYAPLMAGAVPANVRTVETSVIEAQASRAGTRVSGEEPPTTASGHTLPSTPHTRCTATPITLAADHSLARYEGPWGSFELQLPLVGAHNVANALQAIAAANCVTAMARTLRDAMARCPTVPGRLEPVTVAGPGAWPTVLVDYAHTHDSLEKTLVALRPVTRGRLIVLFGCGGDRDRTKRPKMAAVACRLADQVVVTSDNPRTEEPQAIIDDILAGVPAEVRSKVAVEPDRAAAIRVAVNLAHPGDTVLLAGKGHEDYQIVAASGGGTIKRHFDDREHAAEALRAYRQPAGSPS